MIVHVYTFECDRCKKHCRLECENEKWPEICIKTGAKLDYRADPFHGWSLIKKETLND